jgi:hypothetical protein
MLKFFLLVLMVVVALLIYTATRPDTFRITRATLVKAQPDTLFALINDLRRHAAWGPWESLDPAMKRVYSENSRGVGASYAWVGNHQAGTGRIEITESVPYDRVRMKLDYLQPFEAHNSVEFTLDRQGATTLVTWSMQGTNNFMGKLMGLLFSDRLIGGMFEKGLSNLKALAESAAPAALERS